MPVSTTYTPLESIGTSLAAHLLYSWGDTPAPLATPYVPPAELTADVDRGLTLLAQLAYERRNYAARATYYNSRESDFNAAAATYATQTAAHTASIQSTWLKVDLSARSLETELQQIGDSGSYSPGTQTTPLYNVAAVVLRARTAAIAAMRYPSLVAASEALTQGASALETSNANPPVLRDVDMPEVPDGSYLSALVTAATRYLEYLQGS